MAVEDGVFKPPKLGTDGGGTAMPIADLQKNKRKRQRDLYHIHNVCCNQTGQSFRLMKTGCIMCLVLWFVKHQTFTIIFSFNPK